MVHVQAAADEDLQSQLSKRRPPLPPRHEGFAHAVAALADRLENSDTSDVLGSRLPCVTLQALLESPVTTIAKTEMAPLGDSCCYDHVPLNWNKMNYVSSPTCLSSNAEQPAGQIGSLDASELVHEVTQTLVRRLSFGRLRGFRVHRFGLRPAAAAHQDEFNKLLVGYALHRERRSMAAASSDDALDVSNVGGYHSRQDLFSKVQNVKENSDDDDSTAVLSLRTLVATCVRVAAAADMAVLSVSGDDPPLTEGTVGEAMDDDPDGWVNVSRTGDLNYLHHHAGATLATVYYAQVPQDCGGSLLLRLSPGSGQGMSEPDEERHAPWMWTCSGDENVNVLKFESRVKYAEIKPTAGSLLVFPAWLSHSVAPHFGNEPRVSFASNWDFPAVVSESEGEQERPHSETKIG